MPHACPNTPSCHLYLHPRCHLKHSCLNLALSSSHCLYRTPSTWYVRPVCTAVPQELTEDELTRVLTEPRSALCKQYSSLLAMSGARLVYTRPALSAIARKVLW